MCSHVFLYNPVDYIVVSLRFVVAGRTTTSCWSAARTRTTMSSRRRTGAYPVVTFPIARLISDTLIAQANQRLARNSRFDTCMTPSLFCCRKAALKYHPDKNSTGDEAEKKKAEAMFKVRVASLYDLFYPTTPSHTLTFHPLPPPTSEYHVMLRRTLRRRTRS